MIVVDTNVIAYLFIQGEKTGLAQHVAQFDSDWIVPQLWKHEFLNVLATFSRSGGASLEDVEDVWAKALSFLSESERQVDMRFALELAVQNGISAYDAQYIALAQTLGVRCVTEDRRLQTIFPEVAFSMEAILEQLEKSDS